MHKNYLRLIQELLCLMKAHCSQDMQVNINPIECCDTFAVVIGEILPLSDGIGKG